MKKIKELFTEMGIDPDNNKFIVGVSSEIEYEDGSEIRRSGFIKMKLDNIYIRLWLFKRMIILATNKFEIRKTKRHNFKFVIGIAGYPIVK